MRIQSKLPKILWPELVKTTVYILNRTLRKALNWDTPLTRLMKLTGREYKPNLVNLKILGSKAYVRKINMMKSDKLEPKA
jgi:hypothetical protein